MCIVHKSLRMRVKSNKNVEINIRNQELIHYDLVSLHFVSSVPNLVD